MRHITLAAVLAATVLTGGCAMMTTVDTQQVATQAAQDAQVAAVTRTINNGEIQMAQVARDRATNTAVRDLATMIINDHTRSNQELETLVSTRGLTYAEGSATDTLRRNAETSTTNLRQYTGVEFDRAYARSQVDMHQYVLNVIDQNLLPVTTDAQLRTHLQSTRAAVATHLERARQIWGQL